MPNRVRELREEAGLDQQAVAAEWGVSRMTVSSIENERYLPSLPLALRIARFFNSTVEEVFHDVN